MVSNSLRSSSLTKVQQGANVAGSFSCKAKLLEHLRVPSPPWGQISKLTKGHALFVYVHVWTSRFPHARPSTLFRENIHQMNFKCACAAFIFKSAAHQRLSWGELAGPPLALCLLRVDFAVETSPSAAEPTVSLWAGLFEEIINARQRGWLRGWGGTVAVTGTPPTLELAGPWTDQEPGEVKALHPTKPGHSGSLEKPGVPSPEPS